MTSISRLFVGDCDILRTPSPCTGGPPARWGGRGGSAHTPEKKWMGNHQQIGRLDRESEVADCLSLSVAPLHGGGATTDHHTEGEGIAS